MDRSIADRLPDRALPDWLQIQALEERLMSAIPERGADDLAALAEARSALLRSVCGILGAMDDAGLREEALRALMAGNTALAAHAARALAEAAARSAEGARQRRAITAYDAHADGS